MKKYLKLFFLFLFFSSNVLFSQWTLLNSPITSEKYLIDFHAADASNIYGIYMGSNSYYGGDGIIMTSNGGITWNKIGYGEGGFASNFYFLSISPVSAKTVYVGGWTESYTNVFYKTTDGGTTWNKLSFELTSVSPPTSIIHFFDEQNGLIIGGIRDSYLEIYTTTNGGSSWARVAQTSIPVLRTDEKSMQIQIWAGKGNSFWFLTSYGRMYRSTNKGNTWAVGEQKLSRTGRGNPMIAFQDETTGLFAGDYLYRTSNGGETWSTLNFLSDFIPNSICFIPGTTSTYVASSDDGGVIHKLGSAFTIDGGNNWILVDKLKRGKLAFASLTNGWTGVGNSIYKWAGTFSGAEDNDSSLPQCFELNQNYPNPFNPETVIRYQLPVAGYVTLKVFDVLGKEICGSCK